MADKPQSQKSEFVLEFMKLLVTNTVATVIMVPACGSSDENWQNTLKAFIGTLASALLKNDNITIHLAAVDGFLSPTTKTARLTNENAQKFVNSTYHDSHCTLTNECRY